MPQNIYRLIDVNINRVTEALRFLDDVARFVLDDRDLSRGLRAIRHGLAQATQTAADQLLTHRDSDGDVGADSEATPKDDLKTLVRANFKRVQEGLRSLEEATKLPTVSGLLKSDDFRKARFATYTAEKEMVTKLPNGPAITRNRKKGPSRV